MDVATLQKEILGLPSEVQDKLAAFLASLRLKREGLSGDIRARLNDGEPQNWEDWETVKARLQSGNPPA